MGYEKLKEVTVLYVEDEDMMRESVVMLLKRRFKQVFVAANGLEAVNIYKAEHPDVVITDLQMPVMDGMELARQIRALGNTPIVVVSAFNDKERLQREKVTRLTQTEKREYKKRN